MPNQSSAEHQHTVRLIKGLVSNILLGSESQIKWLCLRKKLYLLTNDNNRALISQNKTITAPLQTQEYNHHSS